MTLRQLQDHRQWNDLHRQYQEYSQWSHRRRS